MPPVPRIKAVSEKTPAPASDDGAGARAERWRVRQRGGERARRGGGRRGGGQGRGDRRNHEPPGAGRRRAGIGTGAGSWEPGDRELRSDP